MGGKLLSQYTDDEKVQINYDFFFKIKESLKGKKTEKTKNILDKKFQKHDYLIRQIQRHFFQQSNNYFDENQVDFKELNEQIQIMEAKEKEDKKQFEEARQFLSSYQTKK